MQIVWADDLRGLNGVADQLFRDATGGGTSSGPFGETDCWYLGQNTSNVLDAFDTGNGVTEGGCAMWFRSSGCTNTAQIQFRGADDSIHFRWMVNSSDGGFHYQIYDATGTFRDTSVQMSSDWSHLEIRWKIHDTTGYVIVRINGVEVARAENIDTKGNVASEEVCNMYFGSGWCIGSWMVVSHVCLYTTTGPTDDWVGEHKLSEMAVTGNGTTNNFTKYPGTGESAWQNVDDSPCNEDTDYNYSQTTGHVEEYVLADPSEVGTVLGVCHRVTAKQETAGSTQLKIGIITEGAAVAQGTYDIGAAGYKRYNHVVTTNPDDSQPFEIADLDGIKARIEIL